MDMEAEVVITTIGAGEGLTRARVTTGEVVTDEVDKVWDREGLEVVIVMVLDLEGDIAEEGEVMDRMDMVDREVMEGSEDLEVDMTEIRGKEAEVEWVEIEWGKGVVGMQQL